MSTNDYVFNWNLILIENQSIMDKFKNYSFHNHFIFIRMSK